MNSKQYEELCRYYLAEQLGISVQAIISVEIPNPRRPGLPEYKHQIDLYWETSDRVALYLNIANAKWRGSDKVDQPEVLLLQQVRQKVGAHKAVMLTSTGFTAGAKAAAQDEGIALHIVKPDFDYAVLPQKDADAIQAGIQKIAASGSEPIYLHQVEYKAFEFTDTQPAPTRPSIEYATRVVKGGYSTKVVEGHSHKGDAVGGSRQGGPTIKRGGRETKTGGPGSRKR